MAKRKQKLNIVLIIMGGVILMALTIIGAIWVSQLETKKAESEHPCPPGNHTVHKVNIQNDRVKPEKVVAKRCDKLVVTNLDDKPRFIAFGQHDKHVSYDGITERYLSKDYKMEVNLVKKGTYIFHDHISEEVDGTFTVN